jgi:alkylation response protein AidB-like acyl-CoA dehydrogenase
MMQFSFTPEQEELRSVLRRFLERQCPADRVRAAMAGDPAGDEIWLRAAAELGLAALAVPEQYDGAGAGFVELAVAVEEWGRALAPGPLLATAVAAPATLLASGDSAACARVLPALAAAELTAAVALDAAGQRPPAVTAAQRGDGWVLSGQVPLVLDGLAADVVLVPATADGGLLWFEVPAAGLTREAVPAIDQTRQLANLHFAATPAVAIEAAEPHAILGRTVNVLITALAVEQVGIAARCLELTLGHVRTREQFGRPIGTFQAVQHRCAEMLLRLESARSAAYYAAWAVDGAPAELPRAASLAKSYCSEATAFITAETLQLHGGIGFTWEHDAHLYFKRAKADEVLYGSPAAHRELLGSLVGI